MPKVTLALRNNELKKLSLKNVFHRNVDALGQFKYFPVLLPRSLASGPKIIQIMNTIEKQKSLCKTNSRLGIRRKFKVN